jgi:hypothetical protein
MHPVVAREEEEEDFSTDSVSVAAAEDRYNQHRSIQDRYMEDRYTPGGRVEQ